MDIEGSLSEELSYQPFVGSIDILPEAPFKPLDKWSVSENIAPLAERVHLYACNSLHLLNEKEPSKALYSLDDYQKAYKKEPSITKALALAYKVSKASYASLHKIDTTPATKDDIEELSSIRVNMLSDSEISDETAKKIQELHAKINPFIPSPLDPRKANQMDNLYHINLLKNQIPSDSKLNQKIGDIALRTLEIPENTKFYPLGEDHNKGVNTVYLLKNDKDSAPSSILKLHHNFRIRRHIHKSYEDISLASTAAYLIDMLNGNKCHTPITLQASGTSDGSSELTGVEGHMQSYANSVSPFHQLSQDEKNAVSVQEMHRLCTFRGRIYDADSHNNNTLVSLSESGELKLIPIDLDDSFANLDIEAINTPKHRNELAKLDQAKQPYRQGEIDWILSWDVNRDAMRLKELGLPQGSVQIMRASSWMYQMYCHEQTPNEIYENLRNRSFYRGVKRLYDQVYQGKIGSEKEDDLFEAKVHDFLSSHFSSSSSLEKAS